MWLVDEAECVFERIEAVRCVQLSLSNAPRPPVGRRGPRARGARTSRAAAGSARGGRAALRARSSPRRIAIAPATRSGWLEIGLSLRAESSRENASSGFVPHPLAARAMSSAAIHAGVIAAAAATTTTATAGRSGRANHRPAPPKLARWVEEATRLPPTRGTRSRRRPGSPRTSRSSRGSPSRRQRRAQLPRVRAGQRGSDEASAVRRRRT